MALGDKVEELQRNTAALVERVDNVIKTLAETRDAHSETVRTVADLRREHEREIALHRREIEDLKLWRFELKKEREELSRKVWSFGPSIVGALVGGIMAATVAYFIARR